MAAPVAGFASCEHMNKRPARNQIEGSVVMGVGTVLFEKRSYDRRGGEGRAGPQS
jgi:xanthine dehydrogenase YagR molybdenum-binding subunit